MLHILGESLFYINIIFALIVIFFERKRPMYTLLWITLLLLTSYLGFLAYLFFGLKFYKKRKVTKFYSRTFFKELYQTDGYKLKLVEKRNQMINYINNTVGSKVTYYNNVFFYKEGNSFFKDMLEDIKNAKESINMEFFIFSDDEFGKIIYDELEKKSLEGVSVKIIVDGVGTRCLTRARKKSLKKNNIELKVFFPSTFPFIKIGNIRANYRDHRKICIIDSLISYTGGFNIGKEYIGKGKLGSWRDTGARIEGEASIDIEREFYINWSFLQKKHLDYAETDKILRKKINKVHENLKKYDVNGVQLVSSGPNYETRTIRDCYIRMIMEAKRSIYIETPYFVPDDFLLDCLRMALKSGVEVKIIIPFYPDHPFVQWANQNFSIEMLKEGAEVYKYKEGFLHSKLLIIDNEILSFGSANFDYRSLYQNFEMNCIVYDIELIGYLREVFFEDISKSIRLTKDRINNRGKIEKIKEAICRLMSPII